MSTFRILAACLCLLVPVAPQAVQAGDPVVGYSTSDAQMNAAMAAARESYPSAFLGAIRAREGEDFLLKAGIDTPGNGREHIWTAPISISSTEITAELVNEPVYFEGHVGDEITFAPEQISDWSYRRDGKLHGNYTTRVMLPELPQDEAARLRAILAPLP